MKLTNLNHLPIPFQRAIQKDTYDGGTITDVSATRIIDSPRVSKLAREYYSEMEHDANRNVMAMLGTAIHNIMEEHSPEDWMVEERLFATIPTPDGEKVLSGQIDALEPVKDGVIIHDYKVMTAWKFKTDFKSFEKQGNIYAYLLRKNGYNPVGFNIWGFVRDWAESYAKRDEAYPQTIWNKIELPLWDEEECERYVLERASLHFSDELHECTPEEMWCSDAKFEVKQKGHTRATKLFDSEDQANDWVAEKLITDTKPKNWIISQRPVVRRRCEANWCGVAEWCDQFKKYKGEQIAS